MAAPLPTARTALEAMAVELAIAERAVATRVTAVRAILTVREQSRDARFQATEARDHLAAEFSRLRAILTEPWPDLARSGPHLEWPNQGLAPAEYLGALHRELVRLRREAISKLTEPEGDPTEALERALAAELRRQGKAVQAALVEHLIGRESATGDEIAEKVHGSTLTSEDAIGVNCRRTTRAAESLASPLRYSFRGGRVHKSLLI
ncbi:MAG: hypothetical protein ACLQGP_06830 [Isosphaeraceae bacterium]